MPQSKKKFFVDGEKDQVVSAVVHEPKNREIIKGTVVFCHGLGSDKEGSYKRRCRYLDKKGFRAIRFDFRGNHESSLDFIESNITTRIKDLETVLKNITTGKPLLVHGTSFGGLVSILSSVKPGLKEYIDCLVIKSPVTYLEGLDKIISEIRENGFYEQLPGKKLDKRFIEDVENYSTESTVKDIKVPVLIIHGGKDEVVPITFSEKFYDSLETEKSFVKYKTQGHRFDVSEDMSSLEKSLRFFEKNMLEKDMEKTA